MTTTLQRLLKTPHAAVFDKAPGAELAFRLRHPDAVSWSIAEGGLRATVGSVVHTYDLQALTVTQLAVQLQNDGFEVLSVSPALAGLSAMVLVEGSGDQLLSNGDRVDGFTSLLWALLSSYSGELREAKTQIGNALQQMVITQAEGFWLDLWGALYAEGRRQNESDASYAARIPQEAFRIRVNALAIEQAILDATGEDVRIREPWKFQFILDQSMLSGPDRLYDGATIGYHLIQPVSAQNIDWSKVMPVVHRNRAAGVLVLDPQTKIGSATDAGLDGTMHFGVLSGRTAFTPYEDRALLDYSDISDVSILNHPPRWRRELRRFSYSEIQAIYPGPADYLVDSEMSRDYRVQYFEVEYSGQYWTRQRTWKSADSTWAEFNVIVDVGYSRSS